jgi:hypothetical protein
MSAECWLDMPELTDTTVPQRSIEAAVDMVDVRNLAINTKYDDEHVVSNEPWERQGWQRRNRHTIRDQSPVKMLRHETKEPGAYRTNNRARFLFSVVR